MSLILDSSATIAGFHLEEQTSLLMSMLDDVFLHGCFVPPIWKIEVANVLWAKVRRKEYTAEERNRILEDIQTLPVVVDDQSLERTWSSSILLSDLHDLTVYDATYLELAKRRQLPMATLDRKLALAARTEGIVLIPL